LLAVLLQRAAAALPQMNAHAESPLVAIVGPTASGKSALGVLLAQQFGAKCACDSTQLYRGLMSARGKPTAEERQGVTHHLIDVLEPRKRRLRNYRERAIAVLEDLRARKRCRFSPLYGLYCERC